MRAHKIDQFVLAIIVDGCVAVLQKDMDLLHFHLVFRLLSVQSDVTWKNGNNP